MKKRLFLTSLVVLLLFTATTVTAQNFSMDLDIGVDYNMLDGADVVGVSINPDIAVGNFGFGMSAIIRYSVTESRIISEDWIPDFTGDTNIWEKTQTAAALYIPLFRYVRYGYKGDPLYAKIGDLDNVTIGTGIFVDAYSNTELQPDLRIAGLEVDVDGELIGFPYIGFESFTNDLANFDIIGGRAYIRPLAFVEFPLLHNLQFGGSMIVDRDPDIHAELGDFTATPDMVQMYGADVMMPILNMGLLSLTAYGDYAFQQIPDQEMSSAIRAGAKGKILGFVTYGADITMPQTDAVGYIPSYFNEDYDLDRSVSYESEGITSGNTYLNANAGFELLNEMLVFNLNILGELESSGSALSITDPEMKASFSLGQGVIPFGYFDLAYEKRNLNGDSLDLFFDGVLNPTIDSTIAVNATVVYNMIELQIGGSFDFDDTGEMTPNITIGGDLQLPWFN